MVELTYGGTWLNWKSLNRTDRRWAMLSFVTAFVAALPLGIVAGEWGHEVGYRLGSGGREPPPRIAAEVLASDLFAYAMLGSVVLAVVSAFAWWRFSRNQDEMFNRIQNYAIAQTGGWTIAFALLCWLLWLGGWLPPLHLTALVIFTVTMLTGFWLFAVRKWL